MPRLDTVTRLAAGAHPAAPRALGASVVASGIDPFVMGTPSGAASLRRVLHALQAIDGVWLADTDAIDASAVTRASSAD